MIVIYYSSQSEGGIKIRSVWRSNDTEIALGDGVVTDLEFNILSRNWNLQLIRE
jgi:hypothetical protein